MTESQRNRPQPQRARKKKVFYILLIVLLLGINGFLFYNNMNTSEERDVLAEQRTELLDQRNLFEARIDSLKQTLMDARGLSVELDSIINIKIAELDVLKISYNRKLANKDLEINDLKNDLDKQLKEISQLKFNYTTEVQEWQGRYEETVQEKEELEQAVETRKDEIRELADKINRGAVLTAVDLTAQGIQYRNNNREKETDRAKRIDKLQICFNLAENRIAEPGIKDIYLRILSPEGSTMAVQSMGSGTFVLAESGESSLYTKQVTLEYDPTDPNNQYCTDWHQDNEFVPGIYTFELYQNGYLIGSTTLELKKGGLF